WAGGLRKIKRPDLFLELARRLPDQQFVMVGGATGTEPEYAAGIEASASDIGNLTMTGWKPHSEVLALLKNASLLVNTSTVEGFPNSYLEAWNHGVPVVSFNDVDGLIAREQLGVIARDIDEMEAQLRSLLQDGARLDAMRARVRAIVTERFSPEVLGPKYVAFFERVLEQTRPR
ncbi:MAG TPA: glycosyltransferase family 4 protein, partial [Candidatus Krumholzibacteria bacterium]|nr:glycosyltransferase family 4 protein [Candidatus Krumholzibacteria bacterium]